ncbi:MAG: hypothetical protein FDW93_01785 [Bergeyella sp.]|nr:hypothetical protein [Bergeyella sp.]
MSIKIAYIELETHVEILSDFKNLADSYIYLTVDYLVSEKVFNHMEDKAKQNTFLLSPERIMPFLESQNYRLVIIGTAHRYFGLYHKIAENFATAIIVHNKNFSLLSRGGLLKNILRKELLYRMKLLFREQLLMSPGLYKKAKKLLVLDKHMADGRYTYLPLFYRRRTEYCHEKQKKKLLVVVPGRVSQDRRDYKHIIEKMRSFSQEMEVVFLGRAEGKLLRYIENSLFYLPQNVTLKYFKDFVSAEEFSFYMKQADLLWCPLQESYTFMGSKEIYGKTKMSGNIADAVIYGKTAIFPGKYLSPYPFILEEKSDVEKQICEIRFLSYDFSEVDKKRIQNEFYETLKKIII